ncbi:MAG TPA: FAD-binding protein, partial [Thermoanaerobaculia bacterium]
MHILTCDAIVVGSGAAGLTAALELGPARVAVLTKGRLGTGGSSAAAQGGIAAAVGPGDTPALHAADTLAAGAGLSDPAMADLLTQEGPGRVMRLLALGAEFDRRPTGALSLGREAAHGRRRVLHARGDATGAEVMRALAAQAARASHVTVLEDTFAWDLVTEGGPGGGRVTGLTAVGPRGERLLLRAPAVVLATGGLGRLYARTTNPAEVTGDGLALAARAGARLLDVEMVQFHPTALAAPGADPLPLLTEALRGEGAVLVDEGGRRFLSDEHPEAELAPRDVVARAIARRLAAGHTVYLDARASVGAAFPERFPTVFELCRRHGLDPRREAIPVSP